MMRNDLKISGDLALPGGTFKDVFIRGELETNGDLDCIDYKVYGTSKVNENLKAVTVEVHGNAVIKENVEADKCFFKGNTKIGGNVNCHYANITGYTDIGKSITAEKVKAEGQLTVNGKLHAENFSAHGAFSIHDLLHAADIDITLHGKCQVKKMIGSTIKISKGEEYVPFMKAVKKMVFPSNYYNGALTTESIEGKDVYIEHTQAEVVCGHHVTIGPGCNIGLVRYKGHFEQSPDSKVRSSKRSDTSRLEER